MTLFTAQELSDYVQYDVPQAAAASAEKVVAGWLLNATGLTEFPFQLPPQMFSWAIELGAIAHENPGALSSETTGDKTSMWDRTRRAEILALAAEWAGGGTAGGIPLPRGKFPKSRPWPDPAERWPC